jgi:hypothetical protein
MPDGAGVPTGTPLADPPLIEMISEDPVLRNTKLIAEAWDCDGLNQVSTQTLKGRCHSYWSHSLGHLIPWLPRCPSLSLRISVSLMHGSMQKRGFSGEQNSKVGSKGHKVLYSPLTLKIECLYCSEEPCRPSVLEILTVGKIVTHLSKSVAWDLNP